MKALIGYIVMSNDFPVGLDGNGTLTSSDVTLFDTKEEPEALFQATRERYWRQSGEMERPATERRLIHLKTYEVWREVKKP